MIGKHANALPARTSSGYPEPFRSQVTPREKRALGDAFGLTRIGVNMTTLMPGTASSMRHWHRREDELVYILEGEVVLVTDAGEETLSAGMTAGFAAGNANAHHLINRSSQPVRYLEISNRDLADSVCYTDVDLAAEKDSEGRWFYTHKDGTKY
jgi:uncharacterized cupin superfamily protein